jgi:epoxyqueuosine reductase
MQQPTTDLWPHLQEQIEAFVQESPMNRLERIDGSPIFDSPLLGVADGDDPLFDQYKSIIGAFHLTPREAIRHAMQESPGLANSSLGRLSVICWVLPISERTRLSNREQEEAPSERWAHTRHYGEQFNDALRRYVVNLLQEVGSLAIAPVISPLFKTYYKDVEDPPTSTWSERHILYAAGLGTFSLSDSFITLRGSAMRCGSVVTNLPLPPSPRPYESHVANCLYLCEGSCGECIKRCPAGAITHEGHDKLKCYAYTYGKLSPWRRTYQVDWAGCGLCQTDVPCEAMIPARRK